MNYEEFLKTKIYSIKKSWFDISYEDMNTNMFPYQKKIIQKAISMWKYAIFADCWLWKTLMQLEFARLVFEKTNKPVIIYAPLAVAKQTQKEWVKFWINVSIARDQNDIINWVNITNYDRMHLFDAEQFWWIVLDESSILKSFDWKTTNTLINEYRYTEYKLCCTATPSPNDFTELWNHAEFLNIVSREEMLAMFFINDVSHWDWWRLKWHCEQDFWKFVWSWAVMINSPCQLWDDISYNMPELIINKEIIQTNTDTWWLFTTAVRWLNEQREARKETREVRLERTIDIVNKHKWEQIIIWCDYNEEWDILEKSIEWSNQIKWSDSPEYKENTMLWFADWEFEILITKPSIAWFGMNWQNCHNMIFFGISDSYEKYYQAVRRCRRYWQKEKVNVYIVLWDIETNSLENVLSKQDNHIKMFDMMCKNTLIYFDKFNKEMTTNSWNIINWDSYQLYNGDCVEYIKMMEDNSLDYSIFSPPFADLFTYSNSELDMWNCKWDDEFYTHFWFLVEEMFKKIKPWRLVSFHCMNLPTRKSIEWFIGIKDFRWDLIRLFQKYWFVYHSEVCIWKDPVVAMQRTKAMWLLHKTVKTNASMSRQWLPDYVVTMRKPWDIEEDVRVKHNPEDYPVDYRQKIASPIRMDINQSDTLQKTSARDEKDEKHICPLQLEVIRRCIYLWTNKWDTVFSPFTGIGSEWYVALSLDRKFKWSELKQSYCNQAIKNLKQVVKVERLF